MRKIFLCILFSQQLIFSQSLEDRLKEVEKAFSVTKKDQDTQILDQDFSIDEISDISSTPMPDDDFGNSQEKTKIFGHAYFKTTPKSLTATSDLPLLGDYVVSVNDEISVILSGSKKDSFTLRVGLNGSILFPELGSIQVSGEKFQDVKDRISDLVGISYVGVEADISMSNLAAKKITITGAVKYPGSYLINPFSTISNSIAYSGGVENFASLRKIKLMRGNATYTFDLYDLLIHGDRSNDINIVSGDTILVGSTNNFIDIKGEVHRPMVYEYLPSDKFGDLINYAMGITREANEKVIYFDELIENRLTSTSAIPGDRINSKKLVNLFIPRINEIRNGNIKVIGRSVKETNFDVGEKKLLNEVISELEFSSNLFPFFAMITQSSSDGLFQEKQFFSLASSKIEDIELKENVVIRFFSREDIEGFQEIINSENLKDSDQKEDLAENNMVQEKQPFEDDFINDELYEIFSSIPISNFKSVLFGTKSLSIPIAGNFFPKQLYDYFNNGQSIIESNVSVNVTDGIIESSFERVVDARDVLQVSFPEKNIKKFSVEVDGLVINPGKYIVNTATSVDDLFKIVGGFDIRADTESIIFSRRNIRQKEKESYESARKVILDSYISQIGNPINPSPLVDISSILELVDTSNDDFFPGRLTGDISPGSNTAKETFLQPGDIIFVPSVQNTVTILGEVLQPMTTTYIDELVYQDYISLAGDLSDFADKSSIYVIRSNGTSIPMDRGMLTKLRPQPGDTIIIPRDVDKLDTLPLVSVATKIISDIAFAAASLNVLRN